LRHYSLIPCAVYVFILAKEGIKCSVTPSKPYIHTLHYYEHKFEKGLGEKFNQDPKTSEATILLGIIKIYFYEIKF